MSTDVALRTVGHVARLSSSNGRGRNPSKRAQNISRSPVFKYARHTTPAPLTAYPFLFQTLYYSRLLFTNAHSQDGLLFIYLPPMLC
jgi:hypothetical protein